MKIYTNEGNPFGLKLLLLAKIAKKPVVVEKINLSDTSAKDIFMLPALELNSGLKIYSTNAAAKYLFPDEGEIRDEWLEWTDTTLAPALAHYMSPSPRSDANAQPVLHLLLQELEKRLKNSEYIAGNKLTAVDIALWSLLDLEGGLKKFSNLDTLRKWNQRISALGEVQAVIKEHPLENITFTSLNNANRYNGLHHIPLHLPSSASNNIPAEDHSFADTVTDEEMNTVRNTFVYTPHQARKEPRTVLPKAGERNVLITSALPYVNNVPHLGNIIGCVLSADIFARYSRAAGYNTLYISGTDEYGTATENKALAENLSPREICDKYFELHNGIYRWFGIGFDYFGRTTHTEQTEIVQEAFQDVYKAGYILKESVEQLLCQKCDRFLADRFVEGTCPHPGCGYEDARGDQCDKCGKLVNATELIRPRCKVCNTAPVVRSSDQLFIDLPKIEPKLREWVSHVENGWTNNARVITRSWLREGLKPRCITRDLKWGIPVPHPGFEKKVFYVWFDAPFGYVSMTKRYTKEYQKWWQPAKDTNVELFQFMAKDNVPFHSVVWPSVLLSANKGHVLVSHVMATEYLNYEDGKFSKSRGIGVFGNDAQETGIPADIWRFYLASARPEGQDSSFSWNDLAWRNNSELLNNLGNFINRALVFCEKKFNSTIPAITLTDDEVLFLACINRELRGYVNSLEKAKMRDGIRHLLSISRQANGYMQFQQAWELLKGNEEKKARAATVIGICCNVACLLANLLFPYMPATARTIFKQLNTEQSIINAEKPFITLLLQAGHKIGQPVPLFTKLEATFIEELKTKYGGVQETNQGAAVSVADLEKAVQAQGEKVRQLKSSTKDKAVWQPEVNILLDLKKQLEAAQKAATSTAGTSNATATTNSSVADLEKAVQAQGEKVRQLKSSTKDKAVWQPEVNILLDLKKKLTEAQKSAPAANAATQNTNVQNDANNTSKVKELEERITKQGEKVRLLKGSSDATVWKPEVEILLGLKKELATLTGAPVAQGNKKKKN